MDNPPLQDPPFWLNPLDEWTDADEARHPHPAVGAFVVRCIAFLMSLGCSLPQAIEVTSNAVVETGWGTKYRGNNLGGWKIRKQTAGRGIRWWRAPGHVAGGDALWCYYRVFASIEAFLREWVEHFVPRPGSVSSKATYRACGEAFWAGGDWFPLLIKAGYKGEVTKAHPDASIKDHVWIDGKLEDYWMQHVLGVAVDGRWGPKSRAACRAWQTAHDLAPTGEADAPTLFRWEHPDAPVPAALTGLAGLPAGLDHVEPATTTAASLPRLDHVADDAPQVRVADGAPGQVDDVGPELLQEETLG